MLAADVDGPGEPRWETVALGLRNPWRFSFDPALGELWIGDVGQDEIEEINRVLPRARRAAEEPRLARAGGRPACSTTTGSWPAATSSARSRSTATTTADARSSAGVVYRGTTLRALRERYVYGDFCSGALWTLRPRPAGQVDQVERETAQIPQLTHIGTDARGELVLAAASGELYRAEP